MYSIHLQEANDADGDEAFRAREQLQDLQN
jgi:hypothetical protein